MGGSTNTVLHILAIAHEAACRSRMERIDELSQQDAEHLQGRARRASYHIEDVPQRRAASTRSSARSTRGCPGLLDLDVPDRHRQDAGREHRRVRRPAATASADAQAADPRPPRRRADEPGLDRAERRRRVAIAGRRTGRARGGRRGRPRATATATARRRLRPVRRDPRRSRTPTRRRRPDDALRQPRPRRRGGQDGGRRTRRCSGTPARR